MVNDELETRGVGGCVEAPEQRQRNEEAEASEEVAEPAVEVWALARDEEQEESRPRAA